MVQQYCQEKSKLNHIEVLISKDLIGSVTSHDEFLLTNNVPKEYNKVKEGMKNLKVLSSLSKILVYF